MAITVVGRTDTARDAEGVVHDLMGVCHCDRADISLSALRPQNGAPAPRGGGIAAGAMKGLVGGAVLGAIIGFVIGAASIEVPGFESVIARGPSATILIGAILFSVLGIVVGAISSIERRDGDDYADESTARRAGTLITIHAREEREADCAVNVLRHHGAREIDKRSSDWNKRDWTDHHDTRDWTDRHVPAQETAHESAHESVLRAVPERTAANSPLPEPGQRTYNRPMEEAARASAPEHAAPAAARDQLAAGAAAKEQVAVTADTSNWITRKYTATYFGPERRKAANQTPYQGAEKRHSS